MFEIEDQGWSNSGFKIQRFQGILISRHPKYPIKVLPKITTDQIDSNSACPENVYCDQMDQSSI